MIILMMKIIMQMQINNTIYTIYIYIYIHITITHNIGLGEAEREQAVRHDARGLQRPRLGVE